MRPSIKNAMLVCFGLLAIGCGSTANDEDEPPAGTGPDLFACGVSQDCVQDFGHLGEVTEEALRCGGELVASGGPGAILQTTSPGPYPTEIQTLVMLLGGGELLRQIRSRCMSEGHCAEQNTTEWRLVPLERCDVDVDPADIAGCAEPDGECSWSGQGADCEVVAQEWSCGQP